ncbi:MAG: site-specific integrase [Candidatus Omnitrophica bacterium]|nr:site-specific integrase [Candidatus Omnitrophota bacterium]
MASLRFRSGRYYIDYRVNGQRFRKATGKSKRIAELALKDIEVKIERNDLGFIEKDVELNKLFEEFLAYGITHHAPKTQKRYKGILDNFKEFLKKFPFIKKASQLDSKFFEDYQTFRKVKGVSNKTVNIELICLKAMFNLAIKWNYIWASPTKNVTPLKEENNKKPRFLSKEECKILLENCDEWFYPILYTFLHTGMRKSELENLTWSDVDFERKKIKIRYKDDWSPKTSEREIPISNGLFELLKKRKETNQIRSCPYVFHLKGDKIEANYLRKKYLPLTKQCGFPDVTKIHSLRHTFASHLVMSGVDLPTVKKLMGHADIETTMIYSHLADEHVDKAVEKLSLI